MTKPLFTELMTSELTAVMKETLISCLLCAIRIRPYQADEKSN